MLEMQNSKLIARYLTIIACTYAICVVMIFIYRGPTLDEFWTLWMTDPRMSLSTAYKQRWSTDLHPPLYYFLVWVLRHITGDDYIPARLVNLFPFAVFIPILFLWKKHRGIDPWIATFLTVMVSSPFFLANSVDLRSYYALTVLGACLVMLLRIGRFLPADQPFREKYFIFIAIVTIFISLNIHYSASLLYLILICGEIIRSLLEKKFQWVALLLSTTFIAGILLITGLSITLKTTPNFSYLGTGPMRSIAFIGGGFLLSTIVNWGIDLSILVALVRGKLGKFSAWGWSLATLILAAVALFVQSLINHAMSLNYVLDLIPLGSAFIADLVSSAIFADGLLIVLIGLSAVFSQAVTAYHDYDNSRWVRYADIFRDIQHRCPTAQFVGVDQNALPEFARHPAVSGFIGVFAEGYALVGKHSGVNFTVTSPDKPLHIILDKCPLVLLSEHEVTPERHTLPELLSETKISIAKYRYRVMYMHDYQRLFIFYP